LSYNYLSKICLFKINFKVEAIPKRYKEKSMTKSSLSVSRYINVNAGKIVLAFLLSLVTVMSFMATFPSAEDKQKETYDHKTSHPRWGIRSINATKAWNTTKGSEEVVVAVIDSGIEYSLSSIKDNMWVNEKEIPGDGMDNDENGYVDDVHGWDFWDDDTCAVNGSSINYHGTFVAGIIAATPDETTGIAGVAPGVRLMDLRVLDNQGQLYTTDWSKLVDAINYAIDNGADIINLSIYSTLTPPDFVHESVKQAIESGVLIVGIPGNGGEKVQYFGQWEEILTVGAVDREGSAWNYSNHGSSVDLVGPGVDVLSLTPEGKVESRSGTSFAAAHVAGTAALVLSIQPDLSVSELTEILQESAKDLLEPGYDPKTGYGLVDAEKAIALAQRFRR